jgi:hypothetical protein
LHRKRLASLLMSCVTRILATRQYCCRCSVNSFVTVGTFLTSRCLALDGSHTLLLPRQKILLRSHVLFLLVRRGIMFSECRVQGSKILHSRNSYVLHPYRFGAPKSDEMRFILKFTEVSRLKFVMSNTNAFQANERSQKDVLYEWQSFCCRRLFFSERRGYFLFYLMTLSVAQTMWAVPLFKRSVAVFSLRRPGFDPGQVMWDWGTGADFLRVHRFSLPIHVPPTAPRSSSSSIIVGWYNRPTSGEVIGEPSLTLPHEYEKLKLYSVELLDGSE